LYPRRRLEKSQRNRKIEDEAKSSGRRVSILSPLLFVLALIHKYIGVKGDVIDDG